MKAKSVFMVKCAWDKKVMFSLLLGRNLMPNLNFVSCTSLQVLWSPSDSISMESDIVYWWKDNGQSQGGEAPPAQPQEEEVELHHLQQMGRSHGREHRWCETFLGAGEQRDGGGEHTGSLLWGTYWWHRLILAPFLEPKTSWWGPWPALPPPLGLWGRWAFLSQQPGAVSGSAGHNFHCQHQHCIDCVEKTGSQPKTSPRTPIRVPFGI